MVVIATGGVLGTGSLALLILAGALVGLFLGYFVHFFRETGMRMDESRFEHDPYFSRGKRKRKPKKDIPMWIFLLIGAIIGVIGAILFILLVDDAAGLLTKMVSSMPSTRDDMGF